jgi:hypothetical protein
MKRSTFELLEPLIAAVWARAGLWWDARGNDPNNYVPGMAIINARTAASRIVCGEHGWTLENFEDEKDRRWRKAHYGN